MPKLLYEIHQGEVPPRRPRLPNARMRAMIEGNVLKYPSRVAMSSTAIARHGYKLRTRTAEDGWYVWAEPWKTNTQSKTRKREKRKA